MGVRLTWLFLVSFPLCVLSQPDISKVITEKNTGVVFDHINTLNGLSDNRVISLFQDRYGFLWFGTVDGLNKYDGYDVRVYRHDETDSNSVSSDIIECFAEDACGNLWIGTNRGLNLYMRSEDSFRPCFRNKKDTIALSDEDVRAICFTSDSVMWVETFDGTLNKISGNRKKIEYFPHAAPFQPYFHYHSIFPDSEGFLWLGGRDMAILRFDPRTGKFRNYPEGNGKLQKKERDVACYYEDRFGNFWVSGYDGTYLMNREEGIFKKASPASTTSMAEDSEGNLWFGTEHGLLKYDNLKKQTFLFTNNPDDPTSISGNRIYKLYIDPQGSVWIATNRGIDRITAKRLRFEHIRHVANDPASLSGNAVRALLEDRSGKLWIGTMGEGLNCFYHKPGTFKQYRYRPGVKGGLASDNVNVLYQDSQGNIWIGLWAGIGFQMFDPKNESFRTYRYDPASTKYDWYNDFAEDRSGNFYIGYWGGTGLSLFDRNSFKVTRTLKDKFAKRDRSRMISDLLIDKKGYLWVGTSTVGLFRYDPVGDTSECISEASGNSSSFPGLSVNCLLQDSKARIWVGGNGIGIINEGSRFARRLTEKDGLCDNQVMSILEDRNGNFWIGTRKGLSKLSGDLKKFTNFDLNNGLPFNQFSKASTVMRSGKMAFGGDDGFILFDPDSLQLPFTPPFLVIEHFRVKEMEMISDLSEIRQIQLRHNENFFSLSFGSPGNISPHGCRYAYRLDPFDPDWNFVGSGDRKAVYTNVSPGSYTLTVRLTDLGSDQTLSEKKLSIIISPPFWKEWWFYSLIGLALLGVIFYIIRYREHRLNQKHKTIELKQKLLRSQMNPHFIFNSLFAIQNYIYEHKADEAGRYLSGFARLMRLILENSREEFIPMEKELETLRLYLELQQLRFEKKFNYSLILDPEIDVEYTGIPPMLAQPFIENSLEHGLKNLSTPGNISISFRLDKEVIVFEVTDDGIGITNALSSEEKRKSHVSMATDITRERIQLLNYRLSRKISFAILDRSEEDPGSHGTIVRFEIPYLDINPLEKP